MTRRPITGMVQQLGTHAVKTTCNLQSGIGFNVSEARYYAQCHGAAPGMALAAYLRVPVEPRQASLERDHLAKLTVLQTTVIPAARSKQTSRHTAHGLLEHILRITFGISVTVLPRNCCSSSKSENRSKQKGRCSQHGCGGPRHSSHAAQRRKWQQQIAAQPGIGKGSSGEKRRLFCHITN